MDFEEVWVREAVGARFTPRLERSLIEAQVRRVEEYPMRKTIRESAVVVALDPGDRNTILGVGFNEPSDLILNNFGSIMSAVMRSPAKTYLELAVPDTGNYSRGLWIYSNDSANHCTETDFSPTGSMVWLGSGSAAPSRSDIQITTPFTTSPEKDPFSTTYGSYASAYISFSGSCVAGGSGTVRESGVCWRLKQKSDSTAYNFLIFHDLISPAVDFTAGQILYCVYAVSI